MKIQRFPFVSLLLLQVVLLISTTNTFANSEPGLDLDSRAGEYFKEKQNRKAVLFEESIAEAYFQNSPENENDFSQLYSNPQFEYTLVEADSKNQLTSEFQPNNRSILKTQIFPFHFFW